MTAPDRMLAPFPLDDGLRIGLASPINLRSAIGRISVGVADALIGRGHAVTFIATELDPAAAVQAHPTAAPVVHWRSLSRPEMARRFDIIVCNVGDNYLFHAGLFGLLGVTPTLGVFHDVYLQNLFNGWLWDQAQAHGEAWARRSRFEVLKAVYGRQTADWAMQDSPPSLSELAERAPMTEWLGARFDAALTHADFYAERLRASCPGPIATASLPVRDRAVPPLRARGPNEGAPLQILTVGVMNANKCAEQVIEAIAGSPRLRDTAAYRLAGPIDDGEAERLRALAAQRGFAGLHIDGPVSDEVLLERLNEADIICCLRRPVLEGASASAIEAMLAGRPTVVADAGFYSELPDAFVAKTPADFSIGDLTEQFERLARDESLRLSMGEGGRAWALDRFHLEQYRSALEYLMRDCIEAAPVLRMGDVFGAELAAIGLSPDDPAIGRIASAVGTLLALQ